MLYNVSQLMNARSARARLAGSVAPPPVSQFDEWEASFARISSITDSSIPPEVRAAFARISSITDSKIVPDVRASFARIAVVRSL